MDEAGDEDREITEARLNLWLELARTAYEGGSSGIPLLDDVMREARESGVPFHYAEELVEGVRMDLTNPRYRSLEELRVYSYRVASVVGGWLTELFGVRDPWVLERAFALGHAMQLTNILRDVGEDLRMGRLYLPEDMMARYGVDRALLKAKAENGSPAFPGYRRLIDELMAEAEADYEKAFEGIPSLPPFFRAPVAVAAYVYRGIHREILRNDYDNLGRRASTSLPRKILLGVQGLWRLRRSPTAIRSEMSQRAESRFLLSPRTREGRPHHDPQAVFDLQTMGPHSSSTYAVGFRASPVPLASVSLANWGFFILWGPRHPSPPGPSSGWRSSVLPKPRENRTLGERLERIRAMYFLSVDEGKWADRAKDSLSAIQSSIPSASEEEVTFEAYRGALQVVRAKHARWPANKLKHLQRGARILDGLVAENPDNLEVRYLRLASYLFLPFFLDVTTLWPPIFRHWP